MRKALYIFGQLNDVDVDWLARAGVRRRVAAGEVIIQEGQPVDSLFITLEGKLQVTVAGGRKIAHLGVGEVIGEIAFVDSAPPTATVSAIVDSVVLELKKPDLERRLATDNGLAGRFYRALAIFFAHRLRHATYGLGFGEGGEVRQEAATNMDEIDPSLLDTVAMAGERFERLLRGSANG